MQRLVEICFCLVAVMWGTYAVGMNKLVNKDKDRLAYALQRGAYNEVSSICRSNPVVVNEPLFQLDYGGMTFPLLYALWGYARAEKPYDRDAYKVCVSYLLDYNAEVNCCDHEGETPLHKVHNFGDIKRLCAKGADVNAQNDQGVTPLMRYIERDDDTLADYLIAQKINIFIKDVHGNNAFHYAIIQRNVPMIGILFPQVMNYRVDDFDCPNHSAQTPFALALVSGKKVSQAVRDYMVFYLQNALLKNRSYAVDCFVAKYPQFDYTFFLTWARKHCWQQNPDGTVQELQSLQAFEKLLLLK